MSYYFNKISLIIFSLFLLTTFIKGQTRDEILAGKIRVSPKATVSQTIGFTEVTITYSRPGVKGRKIWGELVPYNKVWRTGANEATKITFSKNVKINGEKLAAGSYSFFAIPGEKEWTLIFNKIPNQWGAFTYNELQDALRVKVKPTQNNFHEWLMYSFSNMTVQPAGKNNSAQVNLMWDKLKVPFKVEAVTSLN
jgi:Protein of unknown function (DUF2911)